MALNLHKIIGGSLAVVNDWQEMVFTKITSQYTSESRDPVIIETELTLKGKMQPLSMSDIYQLGLSTTSYQYYKIFVTGKPTQLLQAQQIGSDTFICNGNKYKVIGNLPWDDGGWREAICYLDEEVGDDIPSK